MRGAAWLRRMQKLREDAVERGRCSWIMGDSLAEVSARLRTVGAQLRENEMLESLTGPHAHSWWVIDWYSHYEIATKNRTPSPADRKWGEKSKSKSSAMERFGHHHPMIRAKLRGEGHQR